MCNGVGSGWWWGVRCREGGMLTSMFKELVFPLQREYSRTMREVKVQLRVGFDWKWVDDEITHSFNYTSQRAKEPHWMAEEEKWKNAWVLWYVRLLCTLCVCVCHTSPLFWLWSCDFVRSRSREQEVGKRKLYHLRVARTHRGWLLTYSCLNENVWSKTVWKIFCHLYSLCVALEHVYVRVHLHIHT